MEKATQDPSERIGRLETGFETFRGELADIRGSLRSIQEAITKARETNWSVVFAGVAIAGSLYASAIRPLSSDLDRQRHDSEILAQAVILRTEKQNELGNAMSGMRVELVEMGKQIVDIREHGSLNTDKRLTVLETIEKNMTEDPIRGGGKVKGKQ